jgi:putative transposase
MIDDSNFWHHRPVHVFEPNTMYLITAGTLHKRHFFHHSTRLQLLQSALFEVIDAYGWKLQAWAVFSNHYHFIAQSPVDARVLRPMIQRLHSQTARQVNRLDGTRGRKVWFQYWDTCLTYEKSYYARLNYVHNNPVKHQLVSAAWRYPFCSAAWFKDNAEPSYRRKVESFRYDQVKIKDDF